MKARAAALAALARVGKDVGRRHRARRVDADEDAAVAGGNGQRHVRSGDGQHERTERDDPQRLRARAESSGAATAACTKNATLE